MDDSRARLQRRLDRERRAREEAESIAETATRELYALNQMKSEFVTIVSHELRTPIAAISGFATTLRREEVRANRALMEEVLDAINRNAGRLNRLVDQLLSASVMQLPGQEVHMERFAFRDVVEQVLADIDHGKVSIELEVAADLPDLETDPKLVRYLLTNLLDNAVKFSPDGGVCTIGAGLETTRFLFWVEDEGVGMTAEQAERAFEPFWQADSSVRRRFGGLGLGLHMTKLIAHLIGAEVSVRSDPGQGSRFEVRIRASRARELSIRKGA